MKILCCVPHEYYGIPGTVSEIYSYFVQSLREMGHIVHHFDQVHQSFDRIAMNDFFLSIVKNGGYDLVLVNMIEDEFIPEVLDEVKKYTILVAWNSDDDIRWESYSAKWYPNFSYMITTYRHIFNSYKKDYPNLLLSQWACTGRYEGIGVAKDIDFSFIGQMYKERAVQIKQIQRSLPIQVYGKGTITSFRGRLKKWLAARLGILCPQEGNVLPDEAAVKAIWNRSKVSYTPLDAWVKGHLQIKARVFDMGLSGTVMLCNKNPDLYEFYEPGKEYVEFGEIDDCISKAKYLLSHENERRKIAEAYYRRTKAEHMWHHRFEKIFATIGLH